MGVRNCYGVVGERMEKMKTSYSMNFSLLYAFLSWIVQAQGILFLLLRVVKEMIYDERRGDLCYPPLSRQKSNNFKSELSHTTNGCAL